MCKTVINTLTRMPSIIDDDDPNVRSLSCHFRFSFSKLAKLKKSKHIWWRIANIKAKKKKKKSTLFKRLYIITSVWNSPIRNWPFIFVPCPFHLSSIRCLCSVFSFHLPNLFCVFSKRSFLGFKMFKNYCKSLGSNWVQINIRYNGCNVKTRNKMKYFI